MLVGNGGCGELLNNFLMPMNVGDWGCILSMWLMMEDYSML